MSGISPQMHEYKTCFGAAILLEPIHPEPLPVSIGNPNLTEATRARKHITCSYRNSQDKNGQGRPPPHWLSQSIAIRPRTLMWQ